MEYINYANRYEAVAHVFDKGNALFLFGRRK